MAVRHCYNVADFRLLAKKNLPSPIFHYMDGAADDELTLKRITAAFDDYELIPNYLVDVEKIDMTTEVLGQRIEWPVFISPTGMSRMFHYKGEPAVARAAARAGTLYTLSTLATTSIEDVAAASDGPKMFQIYVLKDRGLNKEFIDRCRAAKYALVLAPLPYERPNHRASSGLLRSRALQLSRLQRGVTTIGTEKHAKA